MRTTKFFSLVVRRTTNCEPLISNTVSLMFCIICRIPLLHLVGGGAEEQTLISFLLLFALLFPPSLTEEGPQIRECLRASWRRGPPNQRMPMGLPEKGAPKPWRAKEPPRGLSAPGGEGLPVVGYACSILLLLPNKGLTILKSSDHCNFHCLPSFDNKWTKYFLLTLLFLCNLGTSVMQMFFIILSGVIIIPCCYDATVGRDGADLLNVRMILYLLKLSRQHCKKFLLSQITRFTTC